MPVALSVTVKPNLKSIKDFFENPPVTYFQIEQAKILVVATTLLRPDMAYGTGIINDICQHTFSQLSDTVFYRAVVELEKEGVISSYRQNVEGRGRPRRYFKINDEYVPDAQKLVAEYYNKVFLPKFNLAKHKFV